MLQQGKTLAFVDLAVYTGEDVDMFAKLLATYFDITMFPSISQLPCDAVKIHDLTNKSCRDEIDIAGSWVHLKPGEQEEWPFHFLERLFFQYNEKFNDSETCPACIQEGKKQSKSYRANKKKRDRAKKIKQSKKDMATVIAEVERFIYQSPASEAPESHPAPIAVIVWNFFRNGCLMYADKTLMENNYGGRPALEIYAAIAMHICCNHHKLLHYTSIVHGLASQKRAQHRQEACLEFDKHLSLRAVSFTQQRFLEDRNTQRIAAEEVRLRAEEYNLVQKKISLKIARDYIKEQRQALAQKQKSIRREEECLEEEERLFEVSEIRLKEARNRHEESQEEPACCVCLEDPPVVTFSACNHTVCCEVCATDLDLCPICRALIV